MESHIVIAEDVSQGTDEWRRLRMGIPTASRFHEVMAKGKSGGDSVTRRKYILQLAGEQLTGQPEDGYSNHHMQRGNEMEKEARDLYCLHKDTELTQVAFIRNEKLSAGASPDSLVGEQGMVELKTKIPSIHLDVFLRDRLPPEHMAQCQGALWVAEREWLDFVSYWPCLPIFVKRVFRDDDYIKKLETEIRVFNDELRQVVEQIRGKAA